MSAALGWMCLTDEPIPDDLRTILDDLATDETAQLMAPLPWMRAAASAATDGLHRCPQAMLHPDTLDTNADDCCDDPWS